METKASSSRATEFIVNLGKGEDTNVGLTVGQLPGSEISEKSSQKLDAEERRARREAAKKRIAKSDFWNPIIGSTPKTIFTLLPVARKPITVLKQISYTGPDAIPDDLADRKCSHMGLDELLRTLNGIIGTAYTLDTPSLRSILQACIDKDYDFGNAYGYLRPRWQLNFSKFTQYMESYNWKTPRGAKKPCKATTSSIPVFLPVAFERQQWAVSHSWAAPERRQYIWTEINGQQWSVPIPDDIDLSQLRIELLNLGAEYVWLDVLCLRQNGRDDAEKKLLEEEWRLDVPTIGHVYHRSANQPVVCYFSGLGRPFMVEEDALRSERHWMNRAWTLQEHREYIIVAGMTEDSPDFPLEDSSGPTEAALFTEKLSELPYEQPTNVFLALRAMQKRSSVNPVDKIAGLAYLLQCNPLPVYKLNETAEDAWARLIANLPDRYKGDLFFLYPYPGDGHLNWAPSWRQVLENELPTGAGVYVSQNVTFRGSRYRHRAYAIRGCTLRGFENIPAKGVKREGQMIARSSSANPGPLTFDMLALHGVSIPNGRYTLISGRGMTYIEYWVVVNEKEELADGELLVEKVSVIRVRTLGIEGAIREANLGENKLVALY